MLALHFYDALEEEQASVASADDGSDDDVAADAFSPAAESADDASLLPVDSPRADAPHAEAVAHASDASDAPRAPATAIAGLAAAEASQLDVRAPADAQRAEAPADAREPAIPASVPAAEALACGDARDTAPSGLGPPAGVAESDTHPSVAEHVSLAPADASSRTATAAAVLPAGRPAAPAASEHGRTTGIPARSALIAPSDARSDAPVRVVDEGSFARPRRLIRVTAIVAVALGAALLVGCTVGRAPHARPAADTRLWTVRHAGGSGQNASAHVLQAELEADEPQPPALLGAGLPSIDALVQSRGAADAAMSLFGGGDGASSSSSSSASAAPERLDCSACAKGCSYMSTRFCCFSRCVRECPYTMLHLGCALPLDDDARQPFGQHCPLAARCAADAGECKLGPAAPALPSGAPARAASAYSSHRLVHMIDQVCGAPTDDGHGSAGDSDAVHAACMLARDDEAAGDALVASKCTLGARVDVLLCQIRAAEDGMCCADRDESGGAVCSYPRWRRALLGVVLGTLAFVLVACGCAVCCRRAKRAFTCPARLGWQPHGAGAGASAGRPFWLWPHPPSSRMRAASEERDPEAPPPPPPPPYKYGSPNQPAADSDASSMQFDAVSGLARSAVSAIGGAVLGGATLGLGSIDASVPHHWTCPLQGGGDVSLVRLEAASARPTAAPGRAAALASSLAERALLALSHPLADMPTSADEFRVLKRALRAAGADGRGLELCQAWRVEHPSLWRRYAAACGAVGSELERARARGYGQRLVHGAAHEPALSLPGALDERACEARVLIGVRPGVLHPLLGRGFMALAHAPGALAGGVHFAHDAARAAEQAAAPSAERPAPALEEQLWAHAADGAPRAVRFIVLARVALGASVRAQRESAAMSGADEASEAADHAAWRRLRAADGQLAFDADGMRELARIPGLDGRKAGPLHYHSLVLEGPDGAELVLLHPEYAYPEYLLACGSAR